MENFYELVLSVISTNKEQLVQVNGYGDIASNDESANNFYIFWFTYVPYIPQEDLE